MSTLTDITKQVIKLLEENGFIIELGISKVSDYVYHNNINTITIDTLGIQLYNTPSEFTEKELDKQLKEFLHAYIPDLKNIILKIERPLKL